MWKEKLFLYNTNIMHERTMARYAGVMIQWDWIDDTMGSFVQWPKANGTMAQWLDGTMAP